MNGTRRDSEVDILMVSGSRSGADKTRVEDTDVDWDSFSREVCKINLLDESMFVKRKYHWGHHVEGQWVFGGIEENSRKCFLVAFKRHDENTLRPIIQKCIAPGTMIVSDISKTYAISRNIAMSIEQ